MPRTLCSFLPVLQQCVTVCRVRPRDQCEHGSWHRYKGSRNQSSERLLTLTQLVCSTAGMRAWVFWPSHILPTTLGTIFLSHSHYSGPPQICYNPPAKHMHGNPNTKRHNQRKMGAGWPQLPRLSLSARLTRTLQPPGHGRLLAAWGPGWSAHLRAPHTPTVHTDSSAKDALKRDIRVLCCSSFTKTLLEGIVIDIHVWASFHIRIICTTQCGGDRFPSAVSCMSHLVSDLTHGMQGHGKPIS